MGSLGLTLLWSAKQTNRCRRSKTRQIQSNVGSDPTNKRLDAHMSLKEGDPGYKAGKLDDRNPKQGRDSRRLLLESARALGVAPSNHVTGGTEGQPLLET